MLREAVLKNGGGWHGHGWVGDGKWIVKKGNVSSTGRCLSCSEQLACVDTNEVETQKFVDSLVALAMERKAKMNSCESDVVFSEFQDWLEKHGDYEAIVDGANIGLYQQNFVDGSFSLSQVLSQLETEKKKYDELKKIREKTKALGNWWEDPVEELALSQLEGFKGNLENLKKVVTVEASRFFQANVPNFYVGSSSNNAAFGIDDGSHINPDMDLFSQRRMMDINAFNYNQNQIHPNHALPPFGNNAYGINEGFVPEYNVNFRPEYNPNQNQIQNQNQVQIQIQNQSFKRENISEYEHHHGYPPQSRSDYY